VVALNSAVRLVCLQFSFSSGKLVPDIIKGLPRETLEERVKRKKRNSGRLVIEPVAKVHLIQFLSELEEAGYQLVDAFCKERIDGKRRGQTYNMVRFVFARNEFATPSEAFRERRAAIRQELVTFCQSAMWRVRVFDNPMYLDGEEVPDQRAYSINLEARMPLLRADGEPVKEWQKDAQGHKVGLEPLPIQPDYLLRAPHAVIQVEEFSAV